MTAAQISRLIAFALIAAGLLCGVAGTLREVLEAGGHEALVFDGDRIGIE